MCYSLRKSRKIFASIILILFFGSLILPKQRQQYRPSSHRLLKQKYPACLPYHLFHRPDFCLYIFLMDSSTPHSKESPRRGTLSGDSPKNRDELKHVQDNVELMRNRVQLLRSQLQREKEAISKHKSLTREVVQQKIEYNKLYPLKKKDYEAINDEITSLRSRNHSYREMHKNEMNNILKALYLVKLDDARQIKNTSLENRKSLEKASENKQEHQRERRHHFHQQSEQAKKRYLEYWKNKLASVYENSQRNQEEALAVAEEKKKELQLLQLQEMNLLEEINQVRGQEMEAKKQYVAALSLNTKDVAQAVREKQADEQLYKSSNGRESAVEMLSSRSESIRYKQQEFFTKSPHVSLMSSNNIKIPRPKVDQSKFQIILKELRRLEEREKGGPAE